MKVVAGGLLVVAAGVYLVCVTVGHGHGAWGYVQATAEASMIGGLADWFAVTALFRYPLGIRIPHTAIVPRKKDQIGQALAGFVEQHFLTPAVVGERLDALQVSQRLGEWLADPVHAARLADEIGSALAGAAGVLRDDELRIAVTGYMERRIRDAPLAPALARTIDALRDAGQHQVALSAALRGLMRFLDENRAVFRDRLAQESPDWVPDWVDDRVFARAYAGVQSFLADILADPQHQVRIEFERRLTGYAEQLRSDPVVAANTELAKEHLLDHPEMRQWMASTWDHLRSTVVTGSSAPGSDVRATTAALTVSMGEALMTNAELQARVDGWLRGVTGYVLDRYSDEIAAVISTTIERWDAAETGRRIEIQVGRDLQFIRLNGTVVGALVGVAIYTVGRFI